MLGCSGVALAGTPAGMRRVNHRALLARPPCVRRRSCGLVIRAAAEVRLAAHAEPINAEEFVEQHGEVGEKLLEEAPIMARCLGGSSIFLIGMMGCGKSTVGKLAAQLLRYDFCDTDDMIEEKAGKTIAQIFEDEGEEHFRGLETEVLTELADVKRAIISTGGGAAARIENWGNMQSGLVVYLDGSAELLAKRIVEKDGTGSRPMLAGSDSDLKKTEERIAKLLDERRGYYQKADIIVPLEESGASNYGSSPEEVTLRMLMSLDTKTLSWPEE